MPDHIRKRGRNAVEAVLAVAFPGYAVRKGAAFSEDATGLPECGVVAPTTDRDRSDVQTADHSIDYVVVARSVHDEDAFDQLDDLALAAVEPLRAALAAVGFMTTELIREEQLATAVGSTSIALHQMTFRCVASTPADDPSTLV